MKSCLKPSSGSSTPTTDSSSDTRSPAIVEIGPAYIAPPLVKSTRPQCCKTVSFRCESEDDADEVYTADEWDRTPVSVTPKLTYQDILELKEMQLSMRRQNPRAMGSNFPQLLSAVPVGLLPLLPDSAGSTPSSSPSSASTVSSPSYFDKKDVARPLSPPTTPPRRAPAPIPAPPPARTRNFAFLPLLDSSENTASNLSQAAASIAKLDVSSPDSRAGSRSETPPSPPLEKEHRIDGSSPHHPYQQNSKAGPSNSSSLIGPGAQISSVTKSPSSSTSQRKEQQLQERRWNKPSAFFPNRPKPDASQLPSNTCATPSSALRYPHAQYSMNMSSMTSRSMSKNNARPSSPCPPSPPLECDWRTLPSTVGVNFHRKSQKVVRNMQKTRMYWGEGDEDWGSD